MKRKVSVTNQEKGICYQLDTLVKLFYELKLVRVDLPLRSCQKNFICVQHLLPKIARLGSGMRADAAKVQTIVAVHTELDEDMIL